MITTSTRKTKDGYFQPVLIVEQTKQKYTPDDMNCPCLDRKTALKQAEQWRLECYQVNYITRI